MPVVPSRPSSYSSLPFKDIRVSHVPVDSATVTKVLVVAFNRPHKYNAATDNLLSELETAYRIIDQDDRVRVVVLTGTGKAFCAGADLEVGFSAMAANKETKERRDQYRDQSVKMIHPLSSCVRYLLTPFPGAAKLRWP